LQLVSTGFAEIDHGVAGDPELLQERWLDEFFMSQRARGYAATTIEGSSRSLDRLLLRSERFIWEFTSDDVNELLEEMTSAGLATSTKRSQLNDLLSFHRFVRTRKAAEVDAWFGLRLVDPIDEFNSIVHVSDERGAARVPPSVERLDVFFEVLRERIGSSRKYASAARDYAVFRAMYWTGLRCSEFIALDVGDLHWERGPFGKVHVRFGKGARTSGPRPRWVPMLDGVDAVLRWYLQDVRPLFSPTCDALWVVQDGSRMTVSTLQNRLTKLTDAAGVDRFSPHDLRRACATHNYERGVDLIAIQQMLGHWHIGTTMRYVTPSATFIEDAYRRAISSTLADLNTDPEV
jgi:site-specific recombinase XerD